ncbi:MAG: hypothetical protein JWM14_3245 [Chitinophagaceae bacterium]|nr:hypothetical protein [Chitinophagaceae bacterium]
MKRIRYFTDMKQVICLLLLGIYTTFNMGLVMNTHYCAGKVSSVSFTLNNEKSERCSLCGKNEADMSCCQDKQTQLSVDDDQLNASVHFDFVSVSSFCLAVLPSYFTLPATDRAILNKHSSQFYTFETGPPKTAIYIRLHSLIV